ncbi:MAG TPA: hypothetical protein VEW66_01180 [Thermomicrobiales bacterium]|nr:hypothetical protein [Thermomicrobiales bacterium]
MLLIGATVPLILPFLVRLIERWLPRNPAIFTAVESTVAIAVVGLILLVPYGISEISNFIPQLPTFSDTIEDEIRKTIMQFYVRGWIDQHADMGAFLGGIPPILVAMTNSWKVALVLALVYFAIYQIEVNLIAPVSPVRVIAILLRTVSELAYVGRIGNTDDVCSVLPRVTSAAGPPVRRRIWRKLLDAERLQLAWPGPEQGCQT